MLLTDVVLPQMGGKELAIAMQLERPQMRVLFTSGYPDGIVPSQGGLSPDDWFLAKPYTFASLANKVRDVLDAVVTPD